jgi:lactoylglutathione lyase
MNTFETEIEPGVCESQPLQTRGFVFNHCMLRVKEPSRSLDFYTRVIGFRLLRKLDFPEMSFSLYFLAHVCPGQALKTDSGQRMVQTFSRQGVLELTHNWGTEHQPEQAYHNGNSQPQGFGHLCVSVPQLDEAVKWFDENKIPFVKRPDQGKMKDVAFIQDPDGYWIEIIEAARLEMLGSSGQIKNRSTMS